MGPVATTVKVDIHFIGYCQGVTYTRIKGNVASRYQKRCEDTVDGQQSYFHPKYSAFGAVQRLQGERGKWPEIPVPVHQPRREHDAVEVAYGVRARSWSEE